MTTCSPRNFDLVSSYGADAAFDYRDARCPSKVFSFAGSGVSRAFDCISTNESARICAEALSNGNDVLYCHILPFSETFAKRKVLPKILLFWTALGQEVQTLGHRIPAFPEDFNFLRDLVETVEDLLAEGDLKTHPVKEMEGGLESITDGLRMLYNGEISGEKLVYTIGKH